MQLRVRIHPVELWCWSLARAAIMRHHKLGSKNNRNVLVSAVEAEQAKAKGYQGQVLMEGLFPPENIPYHAVLSYGKQRKGEAAWCLFLQQYQSHSEGPNLRPHPLPTSQGPHCSGIQGFVIIKV